MGDDLAGARLKPDLAAMEDWITIWESECRALSGDRETGEALAAAATLWAALAREAAAWLEPSMTSADGMRAAFPRTGAEARAAAFASAPDARDTALAKLAGRVAELERRLAAGASPHTAG